ncbi:MAG: hypothetical protein ACE5E3_04355, partial [Mariprofundus sp.]
LRISLESRHEKCRLQDLGTIILKEEGGSGPLNHSFLIVHQGFIYNFNVVDMSVFSIIHTSPEEWHDYSLNCVMVKGSRKLLQGYRQSLINAWCRLEP